MTQKEIIRKLLNLSKRAGYKHLSIHRSHPYIQECMDWPFSFYESVFAGSQSVVDDDGWPVIWSILSELKIDTGCGNGHQHNILLECDPQAWSLRAGKWCALKE